MEENLSYLLNDLEDDLMKEAETTLGIEEIADLSKEWYDVEWDERFEQIRYGWWTIYNRKEKKKGHQTLQQYSVDTSRDC